ncbi:Putative beta-lactamase HcpC [Sulfitobacter indolifex]|uniref:Beta-lactamase n=1 Tax=Sulfitobacter indolifex HEL-45 TaxID=391624 RepID=A0ABM9X6D1_9RHOB|nr:tetratricopeptide repeat protein [Sulfitobacter indolifex]EDQ05052.1 hypothetical protein OIHEL45_09933 [Sulfitobacter indolifex HEL-45]UOA18101.1 Putative beta-lactamase HcpC [Sulfitobacter indolifex]
MLNDAYTLLVSILGWSFIVAAIFYTVVAFGTSHLSPTKKAVLTQFLSGQKTEATWTIHFCNLFDYWFGEKHFSWHCFVRSAVASVLAVGAIWMLFEPVLGVLTDRVATSLPLWQVLALGAAVNVIPDFVSLFQTRKVLEVFKREHSILVQLCVLVLDAVLTALIIFLGIRGFTLLFGDPVSGADRIAAVEMVAVVSPYAIFFFSTFLTSAWAWAYCLGTWLIRLFAQTGLKTWLNVEEAPGQQIALVGAVIIFAGSFILDSTFSFEPDGRAKLNDTLCEFFPADICDDFARLTDDEERQISYLARACEAGVTAECLGVANRLHGIDDATAVRLWQRSCEAGQAPGCTNLGMSLMNGIGVERNPREAAWRFEIGCHRGDPTACNNLGTMLLVGQGYPKDVEEAKRLFSSACGAGFAIGCTNFGTALDMPGATREEIEKSSAMFQRGCDNGDPAGCTSLGLSYFTGRGVARDFVRAADLSEKGCTGGDPRGCTNLGTSYRDGTGVVTDANKAVALYTKGCEGGHAGGCTMLGYMISNGFGVDGDSMRGLSLYKQGCRTGDLQGCLLAADAMIEQTGSVDDEVFGLLLRSCYGGEDVACNRLRQLPTTGP